MQRILNVVNRRTAWLPENYSKIYIYCNMTPTVDICIRHTIEKCEQSKRREIFNRAFAHGELHVEIQSPLEQPHFNLVLLVSF